MLRKNGTKTVEPSEELKEIIGDTPIEKSEVVLEGPQVSASEAEKVLQQDAQLRANQCAGECQRICEKYRVEILSHVTIVGNQIQSQVVFSAKK